MTSIYSCVKVINYNYFLYIKLLNKNKIYSINSYLTVFSFTIYITNLDIQYAFIIQVSNNMFDFFFLDTIKNLRNKKYFNLSLLII